MQVHSSLYTVASGDEVVEKQSRTSSGLYFNMKDYEVSFYMFVKFVEDQMGSLLDCLDDYGDGILTITKAFMECLFWVRHCDTYFKGRSSLTTNDNLTVQVR